MVPSSKAFEDHRSQYFTMTSIDSSRLEYQYFVHPPFPVLSSAAGRMPAGLTTPRRAAALDSGPALSAAVLLYCGRRPCSATAAGMLGSGKRPPSSSDWPVHWLIQRPYFIILTDRRLMSILTPAGRGSTRRISRVLAVMQSGGF